MKLKELLDQSAIDVLVKTHNPQGLYDQLLKTVEADFPGTHVHATSWGIDAVSGLRMRKLFEHPKYKGLALGCIALAELEANDPAYLATLLQDAVIAGGDAEIDAARMSRASRLFQAYEIVNHARERFASSKVYGFLKSQGFV